MLAYFGAVSSLRPGPDGAGCILVEDAKMAAQDEEPRDVTSSQAPTEESLPTSTAVHSGGGQATSGGGVGGDALVQQQAQPPSEWPSSVLEMPELGQPHSATIPPFQFWNSEFRNKQPAFIRFNFTLPWGANFAVYGRRNVAPSVTQYDFVEFVKGGRVDHRLRRSPPDDADLRELYRPPRHAAVSFTRGVATPGAGVVAELVGHVVPAPAFIVNRNHLERSPDQIVKNQTKRTEQQHQQKPQQQQQQQQQKKQDSRMQSRNRRSTGLGVGTVGGSLLMMVNVTLLQYLDTGRWFLSVYNDDLRPHRVTLVVAEDEGVSTACPNDCSGHGSCYLGKCDCIDGYEGVDCSKMDCPDPTCSGHGSCVGGKCYCKAGWQGINCSSVDQQVYQCLPGCSDHGSYDLETAVCVCDNYWTGADCSQGSKKEDDSYLL
ncbi:teneurin-a-like [Schistocerca piceifrons]|uniref:teneurin-a-like n=1 Tax=Schistocerca piceifrons TaxID=274613 RepID=UPI001F5EF3F5|nr:teneurin-a-like [Schistocerca piceifrons]